MELIGAAAGFPNVFAKVSGLHNVTPHADWTADEIASLLKDAVKPDFDIVQGLMEEAIEDGFGHLTEPDRKAIAAYVKSLKPVHNKVESRP